MSAHTLSPQNNNETLESKKARVLSFDLGRGLAVFLMIVIHVLVFYGSPEVKKSSLGESIHFLLSWPSAALFVFLMGVFIAYSNSKNVIVGLQRAGALFLLGYVLNLFRETIPTLLSLELGLVTIEQLGQYTPINVLLVMDILQYAGVAFAVCILLKHFIPNPFVWVLLAVLISMCSPLLWDIKSGIAVVDHFLKLLWGNASQGAIFPVFPWLTYPLIGMSFGFWFKQQPHQNRAFIYTLLTGIVLIFIGWYVTQTNVDFHAADHLRPGPGIVILITGIAFVWLWLCQWLVVTLPNNRCFNLFYFWSKHVTAMYFIHWLFVGWGMMLFGPEQMDLISLLLWMATVAVLSHLCLHAWLRLLHKIQIPKQAAVVTES